MDILLDALQGLTNDILRRDFAGKVIIENLVDGGNKPLGTKLVRDLIDHDKTVWIVKKNDFRKIMGIGNSAIETVVILDYIELRDARAMDPGFTPTIALGHELIHVSHWIDGGKSNRNRMAYMGLDGVLATATFEELKTVGLLKNVISPIDIGVYYTIFGASTLTENGLRAENGIPLRSRY